MSAMKTHEDVWSYVEDAPVTLADTSGLWHWSTNYDTGCGPFALFLDMIGYSDEEYGMPLYAPTVRFTESRAGMSSWDEYLGYEELARLGRALLEYAQRPHDVRAWIDGLMQYDEA